jgi:hypothetical protein
MNTDQTQHQQQVVDQVWKRAVKTFFSSNILVGFSS